MSTDLDQVWKALSDPSRRKILDLLRNGPKTTTQLVEAFPDMTRHAVMKHIDVLRNSGLVITREEGRRRINSLNPVPIRQIYERWMGPFSELWSSTLLRLRDDVETNKLKLIVVSGLPGSGKSTVAAGIAEQLGLPIFSVDPIVSSIVKSGSTPSSKTDSAAFLVAETLASEQMSLGISVIIDAVNAVNEVREMWRNLSRTHHAELIIIECILDRALHKKRIESRIRNLPGMSETTWDDVLDRRKVWQPWNEERLVLDTAKSAKDNLKEALRYIKSTNKE